MKLKGSKMERIYDVLLGILHDAGYIDVGKASTTEILAALSEYEEKYKDMLEYILMQELEYSG